MRINNKALTLTKLTALAAFMLMATSCATKIPKNAEREFSKSMQTKELVEHWKSSEAPLTIVNDGGSFAITEPLKIPDDVANRPFKSKLSTNNKMSDLAGLLAPMGIFVSIPDTAIRDKGLAIFEFDGKLGDFLNALGAAYQVSFNWNPGNILTIEKTALYMVRIPQDKSVAETIVGNIKSLGAEDVDISMEAGAVSYKADYRTHQRVSNFMEYVSSNAALVSMQVAIVTVALDKNQKTGIDWSQLNFHIGQAAALENASTIGAKAADKIKSSGSGGINNGNNTGSTGGTSDTGTAATDLSGKISNMLIGNGSQFKNMASDSVVGGQGSKIALSKGDFAIGAVVDYLSTYGKTETTQSLLMKTLSGKDVTMKSAKEVPYIDSVGVSNLTGGNSNGNSNNSNNNNNNNNNSGNNGNNSNNGGNGNSNLGFGTVNISTVDIGLDLKLSPYFQARSELVTIGVELKLSSLLSMLELNAGNQIGTVTRPNTQEQEFTDIVKIKTGETVIIGGITYDQKGDNRNAISLFENLGGAHKDSTFSRNAMIIMIRPTVTVFKKVDESVPSAKE